jgi:outer membrane protein assembly factor BamA
MRLFLFSFLLFWALGTSNYCSAQSSSTPPLTLPPVKELTNCNHTKTISSINISGNKRTKTSVILREMSVKSGDLVCVDTLEVLLHLNYQRLYNLNIFTDIQVNSNSVDSQQLEINVVLKEQWFLIPQADVQLADRNINVWWNEHNGDFSRINLGLYLQHKNLTGRLDKLSISSHLGYTQQLSATYFRPYIDRQQKHGIGFGIGYSRSRELAFATAGNKLLFTRHNNDFLYQYFFANASWYYRAAYHTRHIVSAGYNTYLVGDTIVLLNSDYFRNSSTRLSYLELAYRYEYNGVDNWNYPRRGLKIVGSVASRWGMEGMKYQALAGVELGLFSQLKNRWYGSFVFRGRTTFTEQQPYFLQAALGYKSNYVRGYEYYVIEANHFAIGRLSLKYEALRRQFHHLPFRYLPELPFWVYPKIFVDAGYAANNKPMMNNSLANTFLYSIGFGVDIITAYDLKLRIEFAYNHLGENGLYLHANSE